MLGINVHFLKTMIARHLDAICVSAVVQYNPQGCFVKFYGLGCWGLAVVGSDSWVAQKPSTLACTSTLHKKSIDSLSSIRASQLFIDNSPSGPWGREEKAEAFQNFPAKLGSKTDPRPRPPNLHQNVTNIIANTPGKLLTLKGSVWNSIFWQGFPPRSTLPTWAPPAKNWVCRGA